MTRYVGLLPTCLSSRAFERRMRMAVMRLSALSESDVLRILLSRCCAGQISSQNHRCAACSPLEDVAGPHAGNHCNRAPQGPGFFHNDETEQRATWGRMNWLLSWPSSALANDARMHTPNVSLRCPVRRQLSRLYCNARGTDLDRTVAATAADDVIV